MKFLCEQCKAKYQIADEKAAGKTVRMKCRKCGHLIEVRAGVVDGSVSQSQPPPGRSSVVPPAGTGPRAPQRSAPPRAASLATSLASAKPPAAKPADKPGGALAGALKSALQRDEEISAPVDMSDLSPSDEWYVAINGVPVGPIRIAEVRRKAAIGAVTEDSLCWQEGLDEWRPLRSFPELAAIVREAFTSGRSSLTPAPPEGRSSSLPGQPQRASMRPSAPAGAPPRSPTARTSPAASPAPPAARSNVVPITSRLATAEKLPEEAPDDLTRPFTGPPVTPSVVPDPFAAPAAPRAAPFTSGSAPAAMAPFAPAALAAPAGDAGPYRPSIASSLPAGVPVAKKGPPWMAIAMVVAAATFGVTAAVVMFMRPNAAPAPVVVQVPGAPAVTAATTAAPPATTPPETQEPATNPSATGPKPVAMAATPRGTGAATGAATTPPARGPLDLHALAQGNNVAPTEDPGGGAESAPRAPGQCISGGQVQTVIGLHRVALQRACWERSASQRPSANVTVSLTIGADGSAQGVSASGDDAAVAKCIENDVRGWHFPAMGCSQPTSIPFHFVRQ